MARLYGNRFNNTQRRDESRLYKEMETLDNNPIGNPQDMKRPSGMTFVLILSLINACWKILTELISYFFIPITAKMMESGQLQQSYEPIFTMMKWGKEEIDAFMATLQSAMSVNVNYHLITALLFVGSLVGVIMMFKTNKTGLHVYSISQISMLIAASMYLYPKQPQSTFFYDLLLTLMFIFLYYLYFKRMEMAKQNFNQNQDPGLQ